MEKIFGILTGIVLVLSVWIGFKNNSKLADQKGHLQTEQSRMTTNEAEKKAVAAKIKAEQSEILTIEDGTKSAKDNLVSIEGSIDELKAEVSKTESELQAIDEKLEASNELREQISDSEDLIEQVQSTQGKIAQLKADIESEQSSLGSLQQNLSQTESMLAAKKVIAESRSAGISSPSLSTSVRGVYSTWGFVTLNSGNAQGVVPGSILDVLRNGEVVAKLRVSTVEQNRSAADIVPDASGMTVALRSGDRVVAEKAAQ